MPTYYKAVAASNKLANHTYVGIEANINLTKGFKVQMAASMKKLN